MGIARAAIGQIAQPQPNYPQAQPATPSVGGGGMRGLLSQVAGPIATPQAQPPVMPMQTPMQPRPQAPVYTPNRPQSGYQGYRGMQQYGGGGNFQSLLASLLRNRQL